MKGVPCYQKVRFTMFFFVIFSPIVVPRERASRPAATESAGRLSLLFTRRLPSFDAITHRASVSRTDWLRSL